MQRLQRYEQLCVGRHCLPCDQVCLVDGQIVTNRKSPQLLRARERLASPSPKDPVRSPRR
eukprot:1064855-Prorocentrum_minimum.AAC.1